MDWTYRKPRCRFQLDRDARHTISTDVDGLYNFSARDIYDSWHKAKAESCVSTI